MKTSKAKVYQFTVVLEPERDPEFKGYYNASVPALPGCFSYGATKKGALKNTKEAIEVCLESLMAEGEPVPSDAQSSSFLPSKENNSSWHSEKYFKTSWFNCGRIQQVTLRFGNI